jgi:hypothetical protein
MAGAFRHVWQWLHSNVLTGTLDVLCSSTLPCMWRPWRPPLGLCLDSLLLSHAGIALFGTHALNTVYPVHHAVYSTIFTTCVHYTTTAPPAWVIYWRASSTP